MPCPEKFRESLTLFGVDGDLIRQIDDGCGEVVSGSPKSRKAAYFRRATALLRDRLPPERLRELYQWNACCKSGQRAKASRAFAKEHGALPLAEKLALIPSVPHMGVPTLEADGTILVRAVSWLDGGRYRCACSNFNGAREDASAPKEYCYCCAGHFLHHYRLMLGLRLQTAEIVSSPLDSAGAEPCVMRFRILPDGE